MFHYKFIIIFFALLSILLLNTTAGAQKIMSVQVQKSQLRATPSHLGKIVAGVSYGDQVTVVEERGDWKKVSISNGKVQGWLHNSALTTKRIVLKAGQKNVATSVSQEEIALAGKGFSEEIEAQYRKNNKNLDYAWIDRMESFKVSPEQIENFIVVGQLTRNTEGGKP